MGSRSSCNGQILGEMVRCIGCAKTAEPIESFGMSVWDWPKGRVLDGHVRWCQLANMVERLCMAAMSGSAASSGNMAYSQITLGSLVVRYVIRCNVWMWQVRWNACYAMANVFGNEVMHSVMQPHLVNSSSCSFCKNLLCNWNRK